ncbi:C6 transcription factor [Macrophomina phaseolina]|uniref:C6 transcription factor n=1 Tax=Macrophomina phaseolina TaxID=35725 RepID=A0ABQ8FVS5_9PEZI|nr:C6 transcription factor [Macrophomina phaseolina]
MQKRRSHTKSRKGCRPCKQQHIKCDEQGPSCANCIARSTTCSYSNAVSRPTNHAKKLTIPREPPPRLSAHSSGSQRLLELELMHRWSTRTYLSVCSIPQDQPLMQHTVPQRGLEYECLLHSLLALSSLDLATTTAQAGGSNSTRSAAAYTRAAMEYYGKSIALFRREVSDITYANHDSLYLISVLMSLINIAALHFPREDAGGGAAATLPSVLESMPTIFSLLRGATLVGVRCGRWLVDSVESVRIIVAMGAAPPELLDGGTREALARLGAVNDGLHISAVCRRAGQATEDETRAHEMYARAIEGLERCFAEEARGYIDGFLLSFPALAGREFGAAVQKGEPMALLVLMYFAVLMEWHGKKGWWATSIGTALILEISEKLRRLQFTLVPGFQEAVLWAQQQVGLPGLNGVTLPMTS